MKKNVCVLMLFVLLIYSCENNKEINATLDGEVIVLSIEQPNSEQKLPINTLVDSVKYIPLETTNDNLIGISMSKVLFMDDLIIIQDSQAGSVLFFDQEGNYLRKICKVGQGPGEYTAIRRVLSDNENKQILVYDHIRHKMIYYDIYGNFIREISNFSEGHLISDIINLPNGSFVCYCSICFYDDMNTAVWTVDSEGSIIKRLSHNEGKYPLRSLLGNPYLYNLPNGQIGLAPQYGDDIFHVQQDSLQRFLSFDVKNKDGDVEKYRELDDTYANRGNTQEKGNYIIVYWSGADKQVFGCVYSKNSNNVEIGYLDYNDETIPLISGLLLNTNDSDNLILNVNPGTIIGALTGNKISEQTRDILTNIVAGKSDREIEEMNPVIEILYLKK